MKSALQQIISKSKEEEKAYAASRQAEIDSPKTDDNRRNFLKKTALGGIALTRLMGMSFEDTMAQTTSKVNRSSKPSDVKITDMRYALISGKPIIRIDTNQAIQGLGEVRDGADVRYALMLKSRIFGNNPCNVEMLFKTI